MVMMSVVMVVMVSVSLVRVLNVAMLLVAMLALCLGLKSNVGNSVLTKLGAHSVLDLVGISRNNYMHRCVIASSVHTPHVDMMHVKHTIYAHHVLTYGVYRHTLGHPLKK